ncbi:hypothetical protein [Xenorhabdus ehlersii]|uniref:NgrE n=1 Tax=Xenorhabdus ehlersii TaxID=290111 RepID=A0A2D0IJT3_9GAMM|nr:hypothetical protein [Xenorhabdus ehlersii]PHM22030.1 NgrE [Xenorhabdus ehlersii]RKE87878.1 hypothetical protein BDE27_3420 [Xenorhabdus ehlersii]
MFYSQGTISTVSGSAIVRSTGTQFKSNINGVAPGQIILIRSDNNNLIHMIQAVNSDTELVLADNVAVTLNNAKYQIQTTVPDSIMDGVRHMVANNSYITQFLQNMDKWMSQNGTINVTLPNGQTVSLQSIRALQAAMEGKLDKRQNGADIPNKAEFVRNIGLEGAVIQNQPASFDGVEVKGDGWRNFLIKHDSGLDVNFGSQGDYGYVIIQEGVIDRSGFIFRKGVHGDVLALGWNGNVYVAEGGFIKKASPIIQIFPDGTFITNDESEGAIVTKLGLGHYQVSGVLGYNADGAWGVHGGISSPKNNNGLELIYIDDRVQKDGSIMIETFHRQHSHLPERFQNKRIKAIVDEEKVYYQDGEPCDIPEGTRLDVRVQMPENSIWNQQQRLSESK